MARITSKASLTEGTEYDIDLTNKTITLNVAGNLQDGSANGVDLGALYSDIADFWKSDANANKYRFPLDFVDGPIGSMLKMFDGWEFLTPSAQWAATTAYSLGDYVVQTSDNSDKYGADVIFEVTTAGTSGGSEPTWNTTINGTVVDGTVTWTTRRASKNLIRNGGFAYQSSGTINAEFACFIQLGTVKTATDQPYYLITGTTPENFSVADEFHECIQIYGGASHGNFDYRSTSVANFYVRTGGDSYLGYDLLDSQSLSSLTYRSYQIPGSTSTDTGVSVTSPSGAPYSGMTLTLGATTNTINSTVYNFAEGEIDANGGTVQEVYDWFQDLLLSTSDIDSGAGTQRGDTYLDGSLSFVGGVITTSQGLTIKNIASVDESNIIHTDDTGTGRQETFIPTITVNCVDSNGASTSFKTGTRLQLYNSTAASASAWAATTAYTVGQMVLRSTGTGSENGGLGLWMECTTAGTTGGTEPTWDTVIGNTTADGTVTWTTRAIELKNGTVSGTSDATTYASGANANATIRYRLCSVNGATDASTENSGTLTATTTNVSVSVVQATDTVYTTFGTDGSTITNFSADYTATEVDVDVASNFTLADFYSWWVYNRATDDGIRYFFGGLTATDAANFVIHDGAVDITFDNTTTTNLEQTDNIRIQRDDGTYPVTDPTTGGGYVVVNYFGQVYIAETGVSGLTASESSKLLSLNTGAETRDLVWTADATQYNTVDSTGQTLRDANDNAELASL